MSELKNFAVSYSIDYSHRVIVGVKAENEQAAIKIASNAFDACDIWENTPEMPLLFDDYEETEGETLVDMIRENLVAERIAVEHYRELIGFFASHDPATRAMLEGILGVEEEHASDMRDLLVAHEGKPMLSA